MRSISINLSMENTDLDASVEYDISGQYYPETPTSPEEWPEIEIKKVVLISSEIDITVLLEEDSFNESVVNLVLAEIEE